MDDFTVGQKKGITIIWPGQSNNLRVNSIILEQLLRGIEVPFLNPLLQNLLMNFTAMNRLPLEKGAKT
jgi:hypothetical protein